MSVGWPLSSEGSFETEAVVRIRYDYSARWDCADDQPIVRLTGYTIVDNPLRNQEVEWAIGDEWINEFNYVACEADEET